MRDIIAYAAKPGLAGYQGQRVKGYIMLDWLKDILGDTYTEDIDKKISAEIGKNFVSKSDFKTKNEAYKGLQEQLAERDKQLEELKKIDTAGLQEQIEKLQNDNKAAEENYEKQLKDMQFGYSLDAALSGAKVKNLKAVKALLDTEKLAIDNGKILGLEDQIKALKESDAYLFEGEKTAPTFSGPTPGVDISKTKNEPLSLAAALKEKYAKG